jgi:immune inhibitor A
MRRAAYRVCIAALLLLVGTALACGRGSPAPSSATTTPSPTAKPTASTTPTPSPTPTPAAEQPPERDLIDLARRFRGLPANTPREVRQSPYAYQVGDSQQFTLLDVDPPSARTITATLRLITEHGYFFVEDGLDVDDSTLATEGTDFETLVYPTVTAAFGKEWSPGVDADTHISIVHASLNGAGGYFSSSDEYPQQVEPHSNEREAVYVDTSYLDSPGVIYDALLAHELQHLIHWHADSGEESWVNEGLSQVAAELVGGGTSAVADFLATPDTQLTDWPTGYGGLHYGESQLFFRYLLDRFGGRENAAALLAIPDDGIAGVNDYLRQFGTSFEDVFADWTVANYLDEASGPYAHQGADLRVDATTTISGASEGRDSVHQFAADYLEINPPTGSASFIFDGSNQVGIGIPLQDGPFWWSNAGDAIDTRLTQEFDLTGLTSATLRFRTWFDIEMGWDYAYVAASRDGGRTWEALPGRHNSDYDPVEAAYGPGYTGDSDGEWVQDEVDLTPYAGSKVLLRFEYVTDDAAHARGFAVDDIEIPELGFADGADADDGWQAEGFRRVEGPMAQRFVVQLVDRGKPGAPEVERLELGSGNRLEVALDGPATIVVAAVTEGTTEAAAYSWSLRAP